MSSKIFCKFCGVLPGKPKNHGFLTNFSGEFPLFFSTAFTGVFQNPCKDDKPPRLNMQEILHYYGSYYPASGGPRTPISHSPDPLRRGDMRSAAPGGPPLPAKTATFRCEYPALDSGFREAYNTSNRGGPGDLRKNKGGKT